MDSETKCVLIGRITKVVSLSRAIAKARHDLNDLKMDFQDAYSLAEKAIKDAGIQHRLTVVTESGIAEVDPDGKIYTSQDAGFLSTPKN